MSRDEPLTFLEFFAGGGMARAGLGAGWRCLLANDFDPLKAATYRANWGDDHLIEGDVWTLATDDLPGGADLAWASSPCQDFSVAGGRAGLQGGRSSAFWGFWRAIEALHGRGQAPRIVVIENVVGLLSSHGGADFSAVCAALVGLGYRFGALEIDAAAFVPQSRSRVFILAVKDAPPTDLIGGETAHGLAIRQAFGHLPPDLQSGWIWWAPGPTPSRNTDLHSVLERDDAVDWHSEAQTRALISLMAPIHRERVRLAQQSGGRRVGAVFRRMRIENGRPVQRAEVRFDGLAGCLRTPRGGSSRQILLVIDGGQARSRLVTGREGARLMGLPDDYRLPPTATGALHVVGDGVVVPAVRFLADRLIDPLLRGKARAAA